MPNGVQERVFGPGAAGTVSVAIFNTGTIPLTYAVEMTPGASSALGFIAETASVRALTPLPVEPGERATVLIPFLSAPENDHRCRTDNPIFRGVDNFYRGRSPGIGVNN